jgi:acetolactate synthase-1/2/3 large subunit
MATSGPGATNLITGIATSWFDSIPSLHITGQVNDRESRVTVGANVRQAGFQETDIVSMVSTITKSAVKVSDTTELADALSRCVSIATSGRMGPVLIDVPMNVQQEPVSERDYHVALGSSTVGNDADGQITAAALAAELENFLGSAERPLFIMGGGLGLAGTAIVAQEWCDAHSVPYIASWAGLTYLDRNSSGYQGSQGVYGSRHANWTVQAADKIVALGSRLDNRQRTGNPRAYAPFADVYVVDVDPEEIRKFHASERYSGATFDLTNLEAVLERTAFSYEAQPWLEIIDRDKAINSSGWESAVESGEFNPYDAVPALQKHFPARSIVASDTGANLCWLFQAYQADDSFLFTSGGNSPMGYALPAAIGAQIAQPDASVICAIGDGGFQMNIQELQTAVNYRLPITILLFNNAGYGIIKQFQDSNLGRRYHASGEGYSTPDFAKVAESYGIEYHRVTSVVDIVPALFERSLKVVELVLPQQAQITPKAEGDHFLHDQAPHIVGRLQEPLPFDYPERPSDLEISSSL